MQTTDKEIIKERHLKCSEGDIRLLLYSQDKNEEESKIIYDVTIENGIIKSIQIENNK